MVIYLYFALKSLLWLLKSQKLDRIRPKKSNKHLQEKYADDLTIFLEYVDGEDDLNAINIKNILKVLDELFLLSGLGVNKTKTMLSLFGSNLDQDNRAGSLGLNWCTKFTQLGLDFDQNFEEMDKTSIKL